MKTLAVAAIFAMFTTHAFAAPGVEEAIRPIQDEWARVKYQVPEKERADRYRALAIEAHRVAEAYPRQAEPRVWEAIVVSSEAGARGGLGALSMAREAKRKLEEALAIDDRALEGSAYASLGTLYDKVPGWPIGFGDTARAEEYLRRALAINPAGIDPNFFYGEYLVGRGRHAEALPRLETALRAAPRPGRELADAGRREEVVALMVRVKKELAR